MGALALAIQHVDALDVQPLENKVENKVIDTKTETLHTSLDTSAVSQKFIPVTQLAYEKENPTVAVKITTYGTDCYGCYNENGFGGSASGVKLSFDAVKQSDGSWKDGITYDGYYIVAANSSIPMGSIIEISNHGYAGKGLVPGQTFYAMVLDRGAMTLNHLDLFVGSENSSGISIDRSYQPMMKVIRYGY